MIDQMDGDTPNIPRAARKVPAKKAKKKGRPPLVPQKAGGRTEAEDEAYAAAPVRRNAPRPPTREEGTRDPVRDTTRSNGVIVMGRDGEQLTRRRTSVGDKYHIDPNEVPPGWSYQWNSVTVLGKGIHEIEGDLTMHENGWRPVPSHRFPGRWTPRGHEGQIVVDGLRLEERPLSLTQEAKTEDTARAKALIRDRTDALRMTQKQLPGADVARMRNNAGRMNMTIDPGLDIPLPQHELDEG